MKNIFNIVLIIFANIIVGAILIIVITSEMIVNFIKFDFESSKKSAIDLGGLLKMLIDYRSYMSF
jgi:hypothetical protein